MRKFSEQALIHDPIHGYLPFHSVRNLAEDEVTEREILDHPWLQRMRQIHQLQTAWWVFPSAEHTRFQHVVGVMHLAGKVADALYESLNGVCPDVPSRAYVCSLMRLAGLLHDVGHGPFGHFFDEHFLKRFGLTHESLGQHIIRHELGELLRKVRRSPYGELGSDETLDPSHVATLIARPRGDDTSELPRWLTHLRSLFSGIYTVDNMDFVLRDAYMSGYNPRAFDLDRVLHYSFFTEQGLTLHLRGVDALLRFMGVRAELFRTVYFHRTVRALDLTLADLFMESAELLFSGDPREHLSEYQQFTEWSLLVDVRHWVNSPDEKKRRLGPRWRRLLDRQVEWQMLIQRTLTFEPGEAERSSLFDDRDLLEAAIRKRLPSEIKDIELRVDLARHVYRPGEDTPAARQNFVYDPSTGRVSPLQQDLLVRRLPMSQRVCRVYAREMHYAKPVAEALDALLGTSHADDLTNM